MGLIRFLALVVVVYLIAYFVRKLMDKPAATPKKKSVKQIDSVVPCHKCGLHIPENEAILQNEQHYCCEEHAREDADSPS